MFKFIIVLALAFVATADPIHWDKAVEEINKAMDEAIEAIEKEKGWDPMHVPDHREEFEHRLGFIDIKGYLLMKNIEIEGLKNMRRQGNAQVKLNKEMNKLNATVFLGVHGETVTVRSDIEYKIADLHPQEHLVSDIHDFAVILKMDVNEKGEITLNEFEVKEFDHVEHHVHGISPLDPIFDILVDVLTVVFNGYFRDEMTKIMGPTVKKQLEKNHTIEFYY